MEPQQTTRRLHLQRYESGILSRKQDDVVIEEPLEIRLGAHSLTVTMRTPGHDFDLAAGFLFTEGVIRQPGDIENITYCVDETQQYNVLSVTLRPWVTPDLAGTARNFMASSACGLCGKTTIEAVRTRVPANDVSLSVPARIIAMLPDELGTNQRTFRTTGGVHAAWLCTVEGGLIAVSEDVGRHNAVDKLIGREFLAGRTALQDRILVLSGRAGFELVQKAAMASLPIVVAIGAPTTLAIDMAHEAGITLAAFTRAGAFNVYTHAHRITTS